MELTYEMIEKHMNNLCAAMEKCDDKDPESVTHMKSFFAPHSVVRFGDVANVDNSRDYKNGLAAENFSKFRLKVFYNTSENYWIIDEKKKIVAGIIRELLYDPKEEVIHGDCSYYVHFGVDLIGGEVKIVWEHMVSVSAVFRGNRGENLPYSNKDLGFKVEPLSAEEKNLRYDDLLNLLYNNHASMKGVNAGPDSKGEYVKSLHLPDAPCYFTDVARVITSQYMVDMLAERDGVCNLIDNRAPFYTIIDDRKKMGATWLAEDMRKKDGSPDLLCQFFVHYAMGAVKGQPKIKWTRMAAVPTRCMIDHPDGKPLEHPFEN